MDYFIKKDKLPTNPTLEDKVRALVSKYSYLDYETCVWIAKHMKELSRMYHFQMRGLTKAYLGIK